jgi:DNA polymerase
VGSTVTHLHLDFETRSRLDIKKVGLDRYAKNAEVLMLAWAVDDGEPELWLYDDPMPARLDDLLYSGAYSPPVLKVAWNCAFERAILRHCLGMESPIGEWLDPSVLARYATLPPHLKGACEFLGLGDKAKHDGSRLIRKFCMPNRKGGFTQPQDAPADWETFKEYCRQDVIAEREVLQQLQRGFSLPPFERKIWEIDSSINERGIPVDMQFVTEAKKLVDAEKARLMVELTQITGLANPNSGAQLLPWLQARGYPYSSLLKKRVDLALADTHLDSVAANVLRLRSMLSRSSTAKLDAIQNRVSDDGRLRYSYKYLGASRTGRWAGEGVQPQNLPR